MDTAKELKVHPVFLRKLGMMDLSTARRFLELSGWFNPVEICNLVEMAGCVFSTEVWTPYREKKWDNPFLV